MKTGLNGQNPMPTEMHPARTIACDVLGSAGTLRKIVHARWLRRSQQNHLFGFEGSIWPTQPARQYVLMVIGLLS